MRLGRSLSTRYAVQYLYMQWCIDQYTCTVLFHFFTLCLFSLPPPSHYRVLMSMQPQYPVLETQFSPLLLTRVTIGSSSCCYTTLQMLTSRTRKETHFFGLHQIWYTHTMYGQSHLFVGVLARVLEV